MAIKLSAKNSLHQNTNLKVLLPLLQSNIQELNQKISSINEDNPFIQLIENEHLPKEYISSEFNSIEDINSQEPTLYETVLEQIEAPLFPTPVSVKIAKAILDDINKEGYFDGDLEFIARENETSIEQVEKIQQRFMYLEPKGVGARNLQECLLFQLYDLDLDDETYKTIFLIINDPKELERALKKKGFNEINTILKSFAYPPASSFSQKEIDIIPDFIVEFENDNLSLNYNDVYTPSVEVNNYFKASNEQLKQKLKEARSFVELLSLRKTTLHKIVLVILEKQKEFFSKKLIRPLLLKDLAQEFDFCESTISRAVANKYIECNQGIFSLRSFFSYKVSDEHSLDEVKKLLKEIIETENQQKPLSDEKLRVLVNDKLNLKLSRRVITKYRLALNIPSSRDRKQLYLLSK